MAITIPTGIKFEFIKIDSGASVVDVNMDAKRFYANKPTGYYRLFTWPKALFVGNDYEDLKDLVNAEEKVIWDKTNRDTFLGYNLENNRFVCNICAYMGLKDSDLGTAGEMPHPGMAGWYEMDLTTTASDGIIALKQIDNSDIYLKIRNPRETNVTDVGAKIEGSFCIENTKKSVVGSTVIRKNTSLWCKSPEDNSALMVYNNGLPDSIKTLFYTLVNGGKINKASNNTTENYYYQSFLYGKPVLYFADATDSILVTPDPYSGPLFIKNNLGGGVDHVELVETQDPNDILNSDEYVVFLPKLKRKYLNSGLAGTNDLLSSRYYYPTPQFGNQLIGFNGNFTTYSKYPERTGLKFDLLSLCLKDKKFYYNASDLKFEGLYSSQAQKVFNAFTIKRDTINVKEGFVVCFVALIGTDRFIIRLKHGELAKKKSLTGGSFVEVGGATGFEVNCYLANGTKLGGVTVPKNELINGTGFTELGESDVVSANIILVTVYKI